MPFNFSSPEIFSHSRDESKSDSRLKLVSDHLYRSSSLFGDFSTDNFKYVNQTSRFANSLYFGHNERRFYSEFIPEWNLYPSLHDSESTFHSGSSVRSGVPGNPSRRNIAPPRGTLFLGNSPSPGTDFLGISPSFRNFALPLLQVIAWDCFHAYSFAARISQREDNNTNFRWYLISWSFCKYYSLSQC